METTETIREAASPDAPARRTAGSAASPPGSARYFDLNPAIYRIAFVALSLAGGTGILLYIAAWLVIPEEGGEDSIAAGRAETHRDRPRRAIGLATPRVRRRSSRSSRGERLAEPGQRLARRSARGAALVWWQVGRGARGRRRRAGARASRSPAIRRASLFPRRAPARCSSPPACSALLDVGGVWNVDWRFVLGGMVIALGRSSPPAP